MAAALLQVARRLCFRLGKRTGLFEPTAAQEDAVNRAVLESIKIDDFDEYALKAFWRHRQAGHAPGLTHAQVTEILKAVCEMQKEYGITSK